MIKKTLLIGGAVVLLGALLVGREAASYVRTSFGYLTDAAREAVPIEFQVDRARGMIRDLVPEIRKNMHLIAKEEVKLSRLEEQIAACRSRLEKEKEQLLRLKEDLAAGGETFTYAARSYAADEVRADLAGRFERFKTGEATLESLLEIRDARRNSLEAARGKLEGMLASKRQLQVEVEHLEARLQMIAAARAASDYQFDDSRLGRVKELVSELRTRLEVAEKLVETESQYRGEIPLDQPSSDDIVEQVSEYFTPESPADKVAKK